jgi:WD40 repeat protein
VYDILKLNKNSVISASADMTLKIWQITKGHVAKTLTGHRADINTLCDVNVNLVASGSTDMTIRVKNDRIKIRKINELKILKLVYRNKSLI